jgi:hypothetical protein
VKIQNKQFAFKFGNMNTYSSGDECGCGGRGSICCPHKTHLISSYGNKLAEINLKFTALKEYLDHNFCNRKTVHTAIFPAILSLHESTVKYYLHLYIKSDGLRTILHIQHQSSIERGSDLLLSNKLNTKQF